MNSNVNWNLPDMVLSLHYAADINLTLGEVGYLP